MKELITPSKSGAKADFGVEGHRTRLRARLLSAGGDSLHDHEIVEYLLALSIPRRDTKPLAKALLREFGGFGGLMSTDPESLMRLRYPFLRHLPGTPSTAVNDAACMSVRKREAPIPGTQIQARKRPEETTATIN
jgi:hypothetical protein